MPRDYTSKTFLDNAKKGACKRYNKPTDVVKRFWSYVEITGLFDCWLWKGSKNKQGYGSFGTGNGKLIRTHRFSYLINIGSIPNGLQVNHKCHNPSCVNPAHLYVGTQKENIADMFHADRQSCQIGEKGNNAKLTEKQVLEIIELLKTDIQQKELAKMFSVSKQTISMINTGSNWQHIPR